MIKYPWIRISRTIVCRMGKPSRTYKAILIELRSFKGHNWRLATFKLYEINPQTGERINESI